MTNLTRPTFLGGDLPKGVVQYPTDLLEVFVWENFLKPEDCEGLIAEVKDRMVQSSLYTGEVEHYTRTNDTCYLEPDPGTWAAHLEYRLSQAMGFDPTSAEFLQVQSYSPGQEFKMHCDWFPEGEEFAHCTADQGQRTWTVIVYLNEGFEGGETYFKRIDAAVTPVTGRALIFNNLLPNGEPNPMTLHAGLPVKTGHKYAITKWFRERPLATLQSEASKMKLVRSMLAKRAAIAS